MPGRSAAAASVQPTVVSWSVIARTSTPAAAATATSSAGLSVPSDAVEWACKSMRGRGTPEANPPLMGTRSAAPARPREHPGGARLALLPEHELRQRLVDLLGARQVVDPVERLDLARRLHDDRAVAEHAPAQGAPER